MLYTLVIFITNVHMFCVENTYEMLQCVSRHLHKYPYFLYII
jgi:hypothetical protein